MSILRLFRDGSWLEFGKGHLDQWSVYLARPNTPKVLTLETESLGRLEDLARSNSPQALYDDFIVIYNRATHEVQSYIFDLIHSIARAYGKQSLEVEVAFALAYTGMVALERRHRSRPGMKRRQRLGVHMVLAEGCSAVSAAAFARARSSEQITAECLARGF